MLKGFPLCAKVPTRDFKSLDYMILIAEYRSLASRAAIKAAISSCNKSCESTCNSSTGVSPISSAVGASIKTLSSTAIVFTIASRNPATGESGCFMASSL